jgi:hypothetical protein
VIFDDEVRICDWFYRCLPNTRAALLQDRPSGFNLLFEATCSFTVVVVGVVWELVALLALGIFCAWHL